MHVDMSRAGGTTRFDRDFGERSSVRSAMFAAWPNHSAENSMAPYLKAKPKVRKTGAGPIVTVGGRGLMEAESARHLFADTFHNFSK
jgi:hypothetical protein